MIECQNCKYLKEFIIKPLKEKIKKLESKIMTEIKFKIWEFPTTIHFVPKGRFLNLSIMEDIIALEKKLKNNTHFFVTHVKGIHKKEDKKCEIEAIFLEEIYKP